MSAVLTEAQAKALQAVMERHAPEGYDPASDDMTLPFAMKLAEQDEKIVRLEAEKDTLIETARRALKPPGYVRIDMTAGDAEALSLSMSDLLCWHRGYAAGTGDGGDNSPLGVEAARDINIRIKQALNKVENNRG